MCYNHDHSFLTGGLSAILLVSIMLLFEGYLILSMLFLLLVRVNGAHHAIHRGIYIGQIIKLPGTKAWILA